MGALGQEGQVLLFQSFQLCGDAHVGTELLDGVDSGGAVLFNAHLVHTLDTHGPGYLPVLLTGILGIVLHDYGQHHCAGHAVGSVVHCAQGVGHGVGYAQTHVGKAHAGYILAQGHALPAFLCTGNGIAEICGDELDGLQVEHVGHLPGSLGGVALDSVSKSIHAGGGGEALGHGVHHLRVHNGHYGHVVGVNTDEFPFALHVGDNVVDGDLGGGTGCGGHRDYGHAGLLGGSHAFQRTHIGKLGIIDYNAYGLGGIHGGTAAYGQDVISPGGFESLHSVHHVLNGGVGFDVGKDGIGQALCVQNVGYLCNDPVLEKSGAAADEALLEAVGLYFGRYLLDGACAMIGSLI